MTDRITAYLVVLDEPTREDDAEATLAAIRQIKGVLTVEPVVRDILTEQAAGSRRDQRWMDTLGQTIRDVTSREGQRS
jgi:hypothetical protein